MSARTKSDTVKSPLVFRETLKSRKFYDPCNHEVNKVNVSFVLPVMYCAGSCKPSAWQCCPLQPYVLVATGVMGSCFRAALPV